MRPQTLTATNVESTNTAGGIVLVDFWASWCGPCRQFAPAFEAAAAPHDDIAFGKVDTEAEQTLAAAGITPIPTLMASRDGTLVFAQPQPTLERPSPASATWTWTTSAASMPPSRQAEQTA